MGGRAEGHLVRPLGLRTTAAMAQLQSWSGDIGVPAQLPLASPVGATLRITSAA